MAAETNYENEVGRPGLNDEGGREAEKYIAHVGWIE